MNQHIIFFAVTSYYTLGECCEALVISTLFLTAPSLQAVPVAAITTITRLKIQNERAKLMAAILQTRPHRENLTSKPSACTSRTRMF